VLGLAQVCSTPLHGVIGLRKSGKQVNTSCTLIVNKHFIKLKIKTGRRELE
jgi:hypothetical protein